MLTALHAGMTRLEHFPWSGAPRGWVAPGLRLLPHPPYSIFHRIAGDQILILRVLHVARDAPPAFS